MSQDEWMQFVDNKICIISNNPRCPRARNNPGKLANKVIFNG